MCDQTRLDLIRDQPSHTANEQFLLHLLEQQMRKVQRLEVQGLCSIPPKLAGDEEIRGVYAEQMKAAPSSPALDRPAPSMRDLREINDKLDEVLIKVSKILG